MAVTILRWVLFAARPLLVKELAEALVVSDEDLDEYPDTDELPDAWEDGFVDEDYVNEMILGRCGSLLQLRSKTPTTPLSEHTVHFVHFSVKEYISKLCNSLTGSAWASSLGLADVKTEEIRISNICLRYLSLDVFEEIPQDTSVYPFLSYASWAWYFQFSQKVNSALTGHPRENTKGLRSYSVQVESMDTASRSRAHGKRKRLGEPFRCQL